MQNGQISTNGQGAVANRVNNNASLFGLRTRGNQGLSASPIQSGIAAVLKSKTVRTTAAISLYVPNTMVWSQHAQYENVSIANALGSFGDLNAAVGLAEEGHYGAAGAALGSIIPSATAAFKKVLGLTGGGIGGGLRNLGLAAAVLQTIHKIFYYSNRWTLESFNSLSFLHRKHHKKHLLLIKSSICFVFILFPKYLPEVLVVFLYHLPSSTFKFPIMVKTI